MKIIYALLAIAFAVGWAADVTAYILYVSGIKVCSHAHLNFVLAGALIEITLYIYFAKKVLR